MSVSVEIKIKVKFWAIAIRMWTCFLRQADNLETMMGGDTQHTKLRFT